MIILTKNIITFNREAFVTFLQFFKIAMYFSLKSDPLES